MRIPELRGRVGDFAYYYKEHGLYLCKMLCIGKDIWIIEEMTGSWMISDDGQQIIEGTLGYSNAERIT